MMKTIYTIGVFFVLFSCKNEGDKSLKTPTENEKVNTIEKIETAKESPIEEDDFFLAFLEKFLLNPQFQKSRVNFPIVIGDEEVNKNTWKKIEIYSQKEFLSFLIPKELSFDSGTGLSDSISVDVFDFSTKSLASYDFVKKDKIWQLDKIAHPALNDIREYQFLNFLIQFSQNADYQRNHIIFPIQETTLKFENNNLEETESQIPQEDWEFFSLLDEIGSLIIVNGHQQDEIQKIIYLRGIDNGISIEYHFENIKGEWKFFKTEDRST